MGKKTVLEVRVVDLEKRKYPSKHYVYILEVSWSEGTAITIYRRYSDFFEFQCELLERFPEEAGAKDPAQRMIPFLPGKRLLGRSQTRSVAEKRKEKLNDYCRSLIRLPPKISDDQFVIDFFNVRPEDINPVSSEKPSKKTPQEPIQEISDPLVLERFVAVADYTKQKKNECSLEAGQTVEVIDKNSNGWWFVNVDDFNEGWVPATYLEPLYGSGEDTCEVLEPGEEEIHIAMSSYSPQNDDEIGFEKGVLIEVYEKNLDGWWKVRYKDQEGFAPAAYLQRYHGAIVNTEVTTGVQIVSTLKDAITSDGTESARPTKTSSWKPVEAINQKTSKPAIKKLSPKLPETKPKPYEPSGKSDDLSHSTSPRSSESSGPTSPKPVSPKREVETKQKFAPTWHSMNQPYIDKEPIYAPTPRINLGKKKTKPPPPVVKPKPTSPTTSSTFESPEYDLPAPVYECIDHQPKEQIYVTIGDFKPANTADGLAFSAGIMVSVITKNPTGWWYVDMDGTEGWVPSSYLESTISSTATSSVVTKEPPPPLPVRNSVVASSKKDLLTTEKTTRPALSPSPMKKSLPKVEHVPATRAKTVALGTGNKSTGSLRRSQSIDSLDRETGPKPVVKRSKSPPVVRVSQGSNWKPKPGPVKPYRSPGPVHRNSEAKKPAANKTVSPRTTHFTKSQISDPMPSPGSSRHVSLSKTTSLQNTKNANTIMKTSKSINSLIVQENELRSSTIGIRPSKPPPPKASPSPIRKSSYSHQTEQKENTKKPIGTRRVSETSSRLPNAQRKGDEELTSELAGKLKLRKNPAYDTNSTGKPGPPQRPKAPPSRPKDPPKRPGPPRPAPPGGKRPPPPKPYALPSMKKAKLYTAVGDYMGEVDSCLSFNEGDLVEVIEKNDDGWWFVEIGGTQGWAPSSFLEEKSNASNKPSRPSRPNLPTPKRPETHTGPSVPSKSHPPPVRRVSDESTPNSVGGAPKPKPRARPSRSVGGFARATSSYQVPAYEDSGMALVQGRLYEVMEKADSGWWLVKDGDNQGWAPTSHLEAI